MNELLTNLKSLNYSNQFDAERFSWGSLMNCLDYITDSEEDEAFTDRYIKRQGFDSKDAVISGIESRLESKIAELQALLNQVKNLK